MKAQWEKLSARIDALSLRERGLIFVAAAFLLVSLVNALLLDPLMARQRQMSTQVVQQQEKIKDIRAQIDALMQARREAERSSAFLQLQRLQKELAEGDAYIRSRRDKLVPPEKMAELLEQMLRRNGRLKLAGLHTLPVSPLVEPATKAEGDAQTPATEAEVEQVYKHGVRFTVRGNYLDMLDYLNALEHLPSEMIWAEAKFTLVKHPEAELVITVYTLSLDKAWLKI